MKLNFEYISIIFLFIVLVAIEAYGAVLVALLFYGFYTIVVNNKKYENLKEKIEEYF